MDADLKVIAGAVAGLILIVLSVVGYEFYKAHLIGQSITPLETACALDARSHACVALARVN